MSSTVSQYPTRNSVSGIGAEEEDVEREQSEIQIGSTIDSESRFKPIVEEEGVELEQVEELEGRAVIDDPFDPTAIRIATKQSNVSLILERIKHGEINLQPEFQRRDDLWSPQARSRLIESLLLKIPIPGFYMAADNEDNWEVVDGVQRLSTLKDFVLQKSLRLRGLEYLGRFTGFSYERLPRPMQRRISETELFCHVIEPSTPPEVKFNVFRRINTGGKPLTPQEIRHALNPGTVRDLLADLANSESFLIATDRSVSSKRMVDRECVLRFLAFRAMGDRRYKGKLDDFLMNTMAFLDKEPEMQGELRREFLRSMSLASNIFGKEAFRKPSQTGDGQRRNPVNKAVFESLSVALAEVSETEAEVLSSRKEKLVAGLGKIMKEDTQFKKSISLGTGSRHNVEYRFSRMRELMQEVLS